MLLPLLLAATFAADAAPAANPLAPLDFLVGHCWAGEMSGGSVDTHCFEPMFGGKFVRDRHNVKGPKGDYAGESIYAWDPGQKRIVYWYWGAGGEIDQGVVLPRANGFDFPERHLTSPPDLSMRTRWQRNGEDAYDATNEQKKGDGAWKLEWQVHYVRTAEKPADKAKP